MDVAFHSKYNYSFFLIDWLMKGWLIDLWKDEMVPLSRASIYKSIG